MNSSWKSILGLSDLLKLVFDGKSLSEPAFIFFKNTVFYLLLFLALPCNMWDLSSLTRDQTHASCSGSLGS